MSSLHEQSCASGGVQAYLHEQSSGKGITSDAEQWQAQLQHNFTLAYIWSLGGSLPVAGRTGFEAFTRQQLSGLSISLPDGSLYDYDVQVVDDVAAFVPWSDALPSPVEQAAAGELAATPTLLPTPETARLQRLVQV